MYCSVVVKTFLSSVVMWQMVNANETTDFVRKNPTTLQSHTTTDEASTSTSKGEHTTTVATEPGPPEHLANSNPPKNTNETPDEWRPHFKSPVKGENNIFFMETSCFVNPLRFAASEPALVLSQMSACAIESTARANPNAFVYLLYTCRLYPKSVAGSSEMVRSVFALPNTFVWYPCVAELFANSPLHELPARMRNAQYPDHDASDLLRVLTLWMYGGIYLDLDVIVFRSFANLPKNFIGLNGPGEVTSGVLAFGSDKVGHNLASELLKEVRTSYNGLEHYAFNGPAAVLRWLRKRCGYKERRFENTSSPLAVTHNLMWQDCKGMILLPDPVLYPIYVEQISVVYDVGSRNEVMAATKLSTAIHLYASSARLEGRPCVSKYSGQPVMLLQEKNCPAAFDHASLREQCAPNCATGVGGGALVVVLVWGWSRVGRF